MNYPAMVTAQLHEIRNLKYDRDAERKENVYLRNHITKQNDALIAQAEEILQLNRIINELKEREAAASAG